jgi:hypothetical protein
MTNKEKGLLIQHTRERWWKTSLSFLGKIEVVFEEVGGRF